MLKKRLFLVLVMSALIMMFAISGTSYAEDIQGDADMVYTVIDMPFADFFYGELLDIAPDTSAIAANLTAPDPVAGKGYREEGNYDAITSASARLKTGQLPTITKDIFNDGEKDHLVYIGLKDVTIGIPKALYDSILAAQDNGETSVNNVLGYFDKNTPVTTSPASSEYKVLLPDGSFSKMVKESILDEDATAIIAPNDRYGEYLITVSGIDMDKAGDENKLMGMVLTTDDGFRYGMKAVNNFYRLTQANLIAFCVTDGFQEFRDKAVRQYKFTSGLEGKTITQIRYLLKGEPDILINTNLKVGKQLTNPYDADVVQNAVSVADLTYDKNAMTADVTFNGLPEGYDCELTSLSGLSGDIKASASFDKASGKLTIVPSKDVPIAPGSYAVTFGDDEYISVSSSFIIQSGAAEDFVKMLRNRLVMNDSNFVLSDYMAAMTSIIVNDKECTGTTFKPEIFFDENGAVKFDAQTTVRGTTTIYYPEEENEFTIILKATGYPDVTLHADRTLPVIPDSVFDDAAKAMESAGKIDKSTYPKGEAAAVETAKKALEELLANEKATQEEIQTAVNALTAAINTAEKAKTKADQEAKDKAATAAKIAKQKADAKKRTVKGLKVKIKSKKAIVTFKKTKGISAYQVQYKMAGKKWGNLAKSTKKIKVTSKKLKKGKKYSFRVRTITKVAGTNVYGKWTKAKTVKIK